MKIIPFHPPWNPNGPRVSDPDMHHGTCVVHVPWCMPGSLTGGFLWSQWRGKRSGIPGACVTRNFTHLVIGPFQRLYIITGIPKPGKKVFALKRTPGSDHYWLLNENIPFLILHRACVGKDTCTLFPTASCAVGDVFWGFDTAMRCREDHRKFSWKVPDVGTISTSAHRSGENRCQNENEASW